MIPRLAGWSFQLLPKGFAMAHPDGAHVAIIHYRERIHPVRRVSVLVDQVLASWSEFRVEQVGKLERMTTVEGELAAVVSISGTEQGQRTQRDLGFVITDDFYSSTACTCRASDRIAETSAVLRDLVRHDIHALGIRRRRYEYEPPPGWQPVVQSLSCEWIPPGYPRHATTIMVYPANPIAMHGHADLARIPQELAQLGYTVRVIEPPRELTTANGLRGHMQPFAFDKPGEPPALRASLLLRDEQYLYPAEVTSRSPERWAEDMDAFQALVSSIRQIARTHQVPGTAPVLMHWID